MDLFAWSLLAQFIVFIYFEVTTLMPLYPWNDLSKYSMKEKVIEASSNGILLIVCIGLFASKIKFLVGIAVLFYFIFLLMQLLTWWMPYLTGKHLKQFPRSLYESHFANTIKFLPPIKNHIVPDAQHNVLQLLSLIQLLLCFSFFISME
ncbi:MAG: hypothetical protein BAA01_05865 [Bacillus thermozeamaize]|uniref:Uncharacterized protein n=1 Tax=Bacillus thermozeamaize TaxID=230954 RepID=A0A1Y3PBE3_9BACI|nr:MAG: hypothetical protein BAA01_05865 [Bacillus thermozeamaize]